MNTYQIDGAYFWPERRPPTSSEVDPNEEISEGVVETTSIRWSCLAAEPDFK